MAGHLMILNPKRARRSRKRRSGGRRKMTAKQLRYFGPRRSRKTTHRRRRTVLVATANPRRRRRHLRRHRFASNPRRRHHRRFRRNPVPFNMSGFLNGALVPAAIGAVGAIGVDWVIGTGLIPATFTTGAMLPIVRIAAALLVGAGVGALAGAEYGEFAAAGGMVVTIYGLSKTYLQQNMPSLQLARYRPMGRYMGRYMGARKFRRLGFVRRPGMGRVIRRVRGVGLPLLNGWGGAQPNKFRVTRGGQMFSGQLGLRRKRLGYIGPAKTLGRYMGRNR